jgi:hypothetical protein
MDQILRVSAGGIQYIVVVSVRLSRVLLYKIVS